MSEPKDLVPLDVARPPDLYERKYMTGDGVVLYRDKARAPWPWHAIFGASMLAVLGSAVVVGQAWTLALSLPVLATLWLFFAVLRVTVSERSVRVQYGLFGPTIPTAAIESARATTYDWKQFGGWGIKRRLDGAWIYNLPGDGGRAVEVVWRDARGKRRVTFIGTRQAEAMAVQIDHARALPAAPSGPALPPG